MKIIKSFYSSRLFLLGLISVLALGVFFHSISKVKAFPHNPQFTVGEWEIVKSFFRPITKPTDSSNQYLDNADAVALGKNLFFSKQFSRDNKMSCASCHQPERDWSDGLVFAMGTKEGTKNTPSLWNTAFNRWYYWDGRSDSAWSQALGPIENPDEMASNRLAVAHALAQDAEYLSAYRRIFGDDIVRFKALSLPANGSPLLPQGENNHWGELSLEQQKLVNRIFVNVGKSLAAYEATLISPVSEFDKFINKAEHQNTLSPDAVAGLKLFIGKAACVNCHMGPNLTNGEFHNIRLLTYEGGRYDGIRALLDNEFTQISTYSDDTKSTKISYLKLVKRNWAEFKVPSLRRVNFTAPYMHDGRFLQLEDVVDYYSELKTAVTDGHVDEKLIKPLNLSSKEKRQLVAFLKTL